MSKINILSEQIYNRIAAGEVVDRPYSVVKELVENSIDAGATEINIFVERGGKQLIRVCDNGNGIEREDLHSAYLPHATSKISDVKDLDNINTLGFRGEAVASIASVSQMTITSKVEGHTCYSLECNGGKIGEIIEAAGEDGTEITVKNLFYNTPVRYKFLKSDRAEEADITNFISRFILSKPNISFKYYLNDKLILQSYGTNEEEALVCVYGASVLSECYKIDAEKHGIKIRGYIGNQNFSKPNKSYQSVFLNGRYIINSTISAALSNAYNSYMMKRQYPFYVLYIDVPNEIVDVNVHPNKADVRFADNQIIYGCIYSVISSVLDGSSKALDYVVSDRQTNSGKQTEISGIPDTIYPSREREGHEEALSKEKKFACAEFTYDEAKKEIDYDRFHLSKKSGEKLPFDFSEKSKEPSENHMQDRAIEGGLDFSNNRFELNSPDKTAEPGRENPDTTDKNSFVEDIFAQNKQMLAEMEVKAKQDKFDTSSFVYKGNLFNTYLIYECGDDVYIIDQHAAHERLIFDKLKEDMKNRCVIQQPSFFPYIIDVNAFESMFLSDQLYTLREIGFDIDEFGTNSFKVSAVPVDLQNIDLKEFFGDILSDISGLKSIKLNDLLKDKLAMAACKAAVKGGMNLTKEETDKLFAMMNGNLGLKCPHGRPVTVKISKYEIEKMFKRIV